MLRFLASRVVQPAATCHRGSGRRLSLPRSAANDLLPRVNPELSWQGGHSYSQKAQAQESIFVHHTCIGPRIYSLGVVLGLIHALTLLRPGVGYFRPIDSTSHGGNRTKFLQELYKLPDPTEDMKGLTQSEALALIAQDRVDDLIDTILKAYEKYKSRHDFVVVDGTSLKDGSNSAPLMAMLASSLGSPALLVADTVAAVGGDKGLLKQPDWTKVEWEKEVVNVLAEHQRIFKKEHAEVVGGLIYKVPSTPQGKNILSQKMKELGLPLVGAIPEDELLQAIQVHDVKHILGAEVLYGSHLEASLSAVITRTIVGTLHLEELIKHIPQENDPTRGAMVLTHVSRPDILLGLLDVHDSHSKRNLAAVVLTGGKAPSSTIDELIKRRPIETTLPVLVADMPTHETSIAISKAQPAFHLDSSRKIERAQVLFDDHVDLEMLKTVLFAERPVRMNPKLFQHTLFQKAKAAQMHIVLPEGDEPRTIQAAGEVIRRGLAKLTLLGDPTAINAKAKQLRVPLDNITVLDPAKSPDLERYTENLYEARKHKGLTKDQAREQLLQDVNYFGTSMVGAGDADGMVSGAVHTTANTVRPALQIIKTLPFSPIVSSVFFMCLPDKVLVYGDCAINTDPSSEDLAAIAIASADTSAAFGIEPRVAMLSYATGDSNQGPLIQKVIDATKIAKERRPDLAIEGPLQYDAAVNPETAKTKMKGKETAVAGKANVLIFPDLNTGNNTYKAVQQSTGAIAMGPLLQGLRKPVNDLSRGCTVQDIVTTVALTAVQAQGMKETAQQTK